MYQVELIWNRSFNFVPHGSPRESLDSAIEYLKALENMGDGASVKSARVVNREGRVVYANGRKETAHAS